MTTINVKKTLKNLDSIDPEFAKFLRNENDGLLDFDISDEDDVEEEFEEEEKPVKNLKTTVKKRKLEVASDQEDSESDGDTVPAKKKRRPGQVYVTVKMVKKWGKLIHENIFNGLNELGEAFRGAVQSNASSNEKDEAPTKYIVEGILVYEAVVGTCVVEIVPALLDHLKLPEPKSADKIVLPSTSPRWKKVKLLVRSYLDDMLKLLDQIASGKSLEPLMKHLVQLTPFYASYPRLVKPFIRKSIEFWSTSSETARILALRCLINIIPALNDKELKFTFLNLYLSAMKNCQFTTTVSLPAINYMKRSMVELYCLKPAIAYECIYRSLQQVAVYLNGLIGQKKQKVQVINWKFCHSLSVFADFIGKKKDEEHVGKLVNVVASIVLGTMSLYQSPSYIPMWLYCAKILIQLSDQTGCFIPILPIILQPLRSKLFDKTSKVKKMKTCVLSACLRMNKSELKDEAFQNQAIDEMYELLLSYSSSVAHIIGFPELVSHELHVLKDFLKRSRASNYVSKLKVVLEKIQSRCREMEKKRRTSCININDSCAVAEWERKVKEEGCELKTIYDNWIKVRAREMAMQASEKDKICMDDLPDITRPEPKKVTEEDKKRFKSLFKLANDEEEDDDDDDSDDGDDSDDAERFKLNERKLSKLSKKNKDDAKIGNSDDEYSDFDDDELAMLARSPTGSEEEDDDDDVDEVNENDSEDEEDDEDDKPDVVGTLNIDDNNEDEEDDDDGDSDDE